MPIWGDYGRILLRSLLGFVCALGGQPASHSVSGAEHIHGVIVIRWTAGSWRTSVLAFPLKAIRKRPPITSCRGNVVDLEHHESGWSQHFLRHSDPVRQCQGPPRVAVEEQSRCRGGLAQWLMLGQFSEVLNPRSFRKNRNTPGRPLSRSVVCSEFEPVSHRRATHGGIPQELEAGPTSGTQDWPR